MQGAVQKTKEALIKRAVMGKGLEIEVIVVGRLEGMKKWKGIGFKEQGYGMILMGIFATN